MKIFKTIVLILSFQIMCSPAYAASERNAGSAAVTDTAGRILLNQVGYTPNSVKIALLRVKSVGFEIVNIKTGKVAFSGQTGPFQYWDLSGDSVCTADFSKLTIPGKYRLVTDHGTISSYVFQIDRHVYANIARASIKAFYLNRSGMPITREYGGKWARAAGHPDTVVYVHATAASAARPEGTVISGPGGWYDAGDYNKYIVNSGISTYTLLLFCQLYPDYCRLLNTCIPESHNAIPDVLDEALYNLRWMLTMQDPADGGVYHKLTNKTFCDFVMPDKATDKRFVVAKSTAASLDFAATLAMASRVLAKSPEPELTALANTCLEAAKHAYAWAKANPDKYFQNPSDVFTGAYDDTHLEDEFFWASVELGLACNDASMVSQQALGRQNLIVPSWDYAGTSGLLSLALCANPSFELLKNQARHRLQSFADTLVHRADTSPYRVSLNFFKWGSNSDVANMALIKLAVYNFSRNHKYLASVQSDIDYLLGRNATGYCFVTGFGSKKVMHIHHRPSGADGIADPCPGFLAGGPNTVVLNDCPGLTRSQFPARSYADMQCSYSTNEIAINWNAPLFFMLGAMDAESNQ